MKSLPGSDMISMSHPEMIKGLSPYNWIRAHDYVCSATMGASLAATFSGTKSVSLEVDPSTIRVSSASRYPILAWSVNHGPTQVHQLAAGETSFFLSTEVMNPSIEIYIRGMSPFEDRFVGDVPVNSTKLMGFTVDKSATVAAATYSNKIWLNIGDSIMSGDAAAYASGQGRPADDNWAVSDDARASYGYLLAQHYGYRESRLASGGYNWGGGMAGFPALTQLIDQITSTTSRLTGSVLDPKPDVVLVNLGENGIPQSSSVISALTKIRSRVGSAAVMIMMIPISGQGRQELSSAFNFYKSAGTGDTNTHLIDLGDITFDTPDAQHPTTSGHESVYLAAMPKFDAILRDRIADSAKTGSL